MKIPFLLLARLALLCGQPSAAEKPNVLIIVSDDQGYADVGYHGSKQAVSPHLDALAKSGVRCPSGCVTYPVCSPSRAGHGTRGHQVILVGQRPPNIAEGSQARDGVAQVTVILLAAHFRKSPPVVRTPQDEVGFDAELLQIQDARLGALQVAVKETSRWELSAAGPV